MPTKKHLSEKDFTDRCLVALAQGGFIGVSREALTIKISRSGYKGVVELRNIYQAYLLESPGAAEKMLRAFVKDLQSSLAEADKARSELSGAQSLELLRPMLKRESASGEGELKTPFGPEVSVVYAVDLPTAWRFVDRDTAASWSMSQEEIHARAVDNLLEQTRALEPVVLPGSPSIRMYQTGDGFDAARALILDRLHPEAQAFTFTAPNRDQLLYVATATTARLPRVFLEALRQQAEQDYHTLDNALSPHLWRWRRGEASPKILR